MHITLKNIRPLRALIAFFACAFLMLSSAYPAMAFGDSKSSPTDGEVNLTGIERNSEKVLERGPQSPQEMNEQSPGSGGLNEVQGTADFNKMERSGGNQSTPFEKQVEKAFDKVTD
ncbi:MAG: hypothetical protein WBB29_09945 [Geitlerinemataceae cyanobacterium]